MAFLVSKPLAAVFDCTLQLDDSYTECTPPLPQKCGTVLSPLHRVKLLRSCKVIPVILHGVASSPNRWQPFSTARSTTTTRAPNEHPPLPRKYGIVLSPHHCVKPLRSCEVAPVMQSRSGHLTRGFIIAKPLAAVFDCTL